MLFFVKAAQLAGIHATTERRKDVETGDLFEGNTQPKERILPGQVTRTPRWLHLALVAAVGLNACVSSGKIGGALARLALLCALVFATVAFWFSARDRRSQNAAIPITNNGMMGLFLYLGYPLMPAVVVVLLLMVASHLQRPWSSGVTNPSFHGQASAGVALSKHPFGLEREMAKSANMEVHYKRTTVANFDDESSDSVYRMNGKSGQNLVPLVSVQNIPKISEARESYLDPVHDPPPARQKSGDGLQDQATVSSQKDSLEGEGVNAVVAEYASKAQGLARGVTDADFSGNAVTVLEATAVESVNSQDTESGLEKPQPGPQQEFIGSPEQTGPREVQFKSEADVGPGLDLPELATPWDVQSVLKPSEPALPFVAGEDSVAIGPVVGDTEQGEA
jgi:hypothetical protein